MRIHFQPESANKMDLTRNFQANNQEIGQRRQMSEEMNVYKQIHKYNINSAPNCRQ